MYLAATVFDSDLGPLFWTQSAPNSRSLGQTPSQSDAVHNMPRHSVANTATHVR